MKHRNVRKPFKAETWTSHPENRVGLVKKILSRLSLSVRKDQLEMLIRLLNPNPRMKVLDVGLAPVENMVDANYFEKNYLYRRQITAVSVEDCSRILKNYPEIKFKKVKPHSNLPFKNKQFDIVTSWATLEHVGDYDKQVFFIKELLRVGTKVFITTPYRACIYEPHTGMFFIHWLPLSVFRKICRYLGLTFWASPSNLNPLYMKDIKKMLPDINVHCFVYKTLGIVPSHLIIVKT